VTRRPTEARRAVAALLLLALASCARPSGPGAGSAPAPAERATEAPAPAAARDPIAPITVADYASTLAARRGALVDRGLRIAPDEVGYYMDVQEARLRQLGGPALRLTRRDLSVVLELPGSLNFEVGSAQLSARARAGLTGVAQVLTDYRLTIVSVEGHADGSGDRKANLELSEQRAAAVARFLVAGGVEPDRLVVVGRGSVRPVGDNTTEVGREANRRVVLRIDPLQR
jgi:outer membrane protein OmpA-like peptidoglycan-associated protein